MYEIHCQKSCEQGPENAATVPILPSQPTIVEKNNLRLNSFLTVCIEILVIMHKNDSSILGSG